jgi:hypothetical protein
MSGTSSLAHSGLANGACSVRQVSFCPYTSLVAAVGKAAAVWSLPLFRLAVMLRIRDAVPQHRITMKYTDCFTAAF